MRKKMTKKLGTKAFSPPPIVDGPFVVEEISIDKYKDYELAYWLNQQLLDGLELVSSVPVVSVRHQMACTKSIKFIFRRIR